MSTRLHWLSVFETEGPVPDDGTEIIEEEDTGVPPLSPEEPVA